MLIKFMTVSKAATTFFFFCCILGKIYAIDVNRWLFQFSFIHRFDYWGNFLQTADPINGVEFKPPTCWTVEIGVIWGGVGSFLQSCRATFQAWGSSTCIRPKWWFCVTHHVINLIQTPLELPSQWATVAPDPLVVPDWAFQELGASSRHHLSPESPLFWGVPAHTHKHTQIHTHTSVAPHCALPDSRHRKCFRLVTSPRQQNNQRIIGNVSHAKCQWRCGGFCQGS